MNLQERFNIIDTAFAGFAVETIAIQERLIGGFADRMHKEPFRICQTAGEAAVWPPACGFSKLRAIIQTKIEAARMLGKSEHAAYKPIALCQYIAADRALDRLLGA